MGGKAVHKNQLLITVMPLDTSFLGSLKTVYLELTVLKGLPFPQYPESAAQYLC